MSPFATHPPDSARAPKHLPMQRKADSAAIFGIPFLFGRSSRNRVVRRISLHNDPGSKSGSQLARGSHRAPPGHSAGRKLRPARTRLTSLRQCSSGHCQGSRSDSGVFIYSSSTSGSGRRRRREDGRSGEIRTHDPQHPMLMRYQAALRSDRAALPTRAIIVFRPKPRNRPEVLRLRPSSSCPRRAVPDHG